MKQKNKTRLARAAMTLLLALLTTFGAWAQTTVTIGEGTVTSNTNPIGTYYNYSITEQLYTAEEIGMAGTISSISFYYMGLAEKDLPITVYMKHVDEENLASAGISLADADEVFSGTLSVTTTAGWVTINLDAPFAYNGTSNLLIGINKDYLYYVSGQSWQGTATSTTMARYTQNDYNSYDTSTVPGTAQTNRPNIQIEITPGSGPTCTKPETLEVSDITGYGATLTWTSEVGNYTFEYKKTSASEWTVVTGLTATTYEMKNLEPFTTYNVRVKAVCGVGLESGYRTTTFTTLDACPDGKVCIGSGTATNSYLPTYLYYNYSLTQQIYTAAEIGDACAVESIDFYCAGSFTRNFDIYLVSTTKTTFDNSTDWVSVTANDLVYSGDVTFTENAWTTIVFDTPFIYDGTSNVVLVIDDNTEDYVSSKNFGVFDATSQALRIYSDDTNYDPTNPSSYTGTVMNVKNRVRLGIGELPSCIKPTGLTVSNVSAHSADLSWTSDAEAWEIEVNGVASNITENPYTLTGLTPDTEYTVKVRANCGDDGFSEWSNAVTFTTEVVCPAPTSVMASNIAPTSAIISWTGNADATSYNLRYRENTSPNNDFESSSLSKWTTIDADGDGYTWVVASASAGVYHNANADLTGEGHNGSYDFVISGSFSNATGAALNPDNYLVSPQVNLGGSITFWAQAQDASYPEEHFGVAVSTTGNTNASDFTTIAEWTMTAKSVGAKSKPGTTRSGNRAQGNWYKYTVDLSAYSGQGYVAIRHFDCTDQFLLNVDDIEIEQPNFVAPEWTTVEGATSPYTIEGLTPSTDYEVEVQAVNADGTSTWVGTNFTTLEEVPRPSDLAVSEITSRTAKLNWTENGEATAWELCLNNDESNLIAADSKPFTLPNLTPETQYSVKVRAIKGEKKSDWSSSITFTTDIACPAPTELAADNITSTTAEIIWNADPAATGFELQYAERPAVTGTSVLSYDDGTYATAIGNSSVGTWTWGVMYPGSMVTATALNKVSIYESSFNTGDITINVYQGGDDAPGTLLYTETVAPKAADGFHEVILSSPVALTAEQNLWITLTETGTYVMSACYVDDDNNQWVYNNGAWANIGTLASSLQDYGWMIRAEIGTAASTELIWSNSEDATSPYEMSGLTPGSTYVVRVKALYDEEESDWASTIFTTDALAPTDLTVSNILSSSATISWTGYCDTYNVFLGTPINLISVDFEDQVIPADFTNDETYPWEVVAGNNGYCIQSSNAGVASSTSAISVSKTFTKDGTIEFDAECKGEGTSTAWDQCIFSIDETAKFTYGANVNGWNHYSFPVSAGEHTFTWSYSKDGSVNPTGDYFAVDNLVMNESDINWADTPIEVTETECALTGLTPNTTYYVQVVGVIGENNYESGIVSFTTLDGAIIKFAAEGYATYYNGAKDVVLPAGMKALVVTDGNTTLTYAPIADGDTDDNVVPAATAMLLQVEPSRGDQEKIITLTTPTATSYAGTNLLHGSDTETTTTGGTKYYKLTYSNNNDNFGWYWGAAAGGAFTSPAHKAWLALGSSGAPSFLGLPDWDTTGIDPVSVNSEDGEWYTLQGMKVGKKPTTTGVYIHNGRKVLIP